MDKLAPKSEFFIYYPQLKPHIVRPGDWLRFAIQSLYLVFMSEKPRVAQREKRERSIWFIVPYLLQFLIKLDSVISSTFRRAIGKHYDSERTMFKSLARAQFWEAPRIRTLILVVFCALLIVLITVPFSLSAQAIFMALILFVAYSLRGIQGRMSTMIMVTLSITISSRYIWWRLTETLNWGDPFALFLGFGLLAAEIYAWVILILGFFQTIHPLERKPVVLPKDTSLWPSVDVYIPTYNEPLSVVKPTVIAALALDWPEDKLNIYVLDDGKREEFREFAQQVGANYLIRPNNHHAKAGNLNHAMKHTDGELIAIFDCDHIPVRSFLQMTVGQFLKDEKMCLVQTPHHFFSADPFEKNLNNFAKVPNENMLFYGLIQDGNDMWDATFFCGSCAVLRRSALDDIGGFAVETVTEDAHTALKMQRKGYHTAYINIPQAAGLATDSLSTHVGQRIRWARGMAQILRLDNPLAGKGLSLAQRLCYLNATLHFFAGVPRIVFLTAPLAFIYFDAYIIFAPFMAILLYVVPSLVQVKITNSRIQGKWRYSFWGEVYETVLAWYILKPTTMALIMPHKGKFNVTQKGGLTEKDFYDWDISKPYLVLAIFNVVGLVIGFGRLGVSDAVQIGILIISMAWSLYNLMIIGAAICVATEARQVRKSHRIGCHFPAIIYTSSGHTIKTIVTDFSNSGVGIDLPTEGLVKHGEKIQLLISRGRKQFSFTSDVVNVTKSRVGLRLHALSPEKERQYIECTFCRADAWLGWQENFAHDLPSENFKHIVRVSFRGFKSLFLHAPKSAQPFVKALIQLVELIDSFLPRKPLDKDKIKNEFY
ncbi:Cellulose synthase catalytic subunit [UDP-forming] [Pseudoalteromonas luteoviolacea B = ATCC 29581]|nr:Cellulose synthase catalytic subunit [UDP-forming] [Pseudoalteromonas luteoviolacea B = ATCC 29581]